MALMVTGVPLRSSKEFLDTRSGSGITRSITVSMLWVNTVYYLWSQENFGGRSRCRQDRGIKHVVVRLQNYTFPSPSLQNIGPRAEGFFGLVFCFGTRVAGRLPDRVSARLRFQRGVCRYAPRRRGEKSGGRNTKRGRGEGEDRSASGYQE